MGDREREEPSTPILETSAVADRRKAEEMVGSGEESEAVTDDGVEMGIRCGKTNERGHEGQTDLGRTTTSEGRKKEHALQPTESQETSVHSNKPQRVTNDEGRMKPLRGEYEEEDDDGSWHDAIEDWWEATAYGEGSSTPVPETSAVRPLW